MKNFTVIIAAKGIERLKTNAFQLVIYALPGKARKLMLLTNVAKIDIPTTHAGSFLPPEVYCSVLLFLNIKRAPTTTLPSVSTEKTMMSGSESFMVWNIRIILKRESQMPI
jgi:hypothetical protein